MTLQDLGAIGDLVGAIAVVASLVYLAIQIRQNTQQIALNVETNRLSALERNIDAAVRMREMLISQPEITDLFLNGMRDLDGLSRRDRFRYDQLMRNVMSTFQAAYLRHLSTDTDPDGFEGAGELIESILAFPGARRWLETGSFDWRPQFREFLAERLSNANEKSEQQTNASVAKPDDTGEDQ